MGSYAVILKLGFRCAFDGMVQGDTETSMRIEFAMYLLSFFSFFLEIKTCVHQVQIAVHNSIYLTGVEYDLTHIFTTNSGCFSLSRAQDLNSK